MPLFFTKEIKSKNNKYIDLDGAGIIYPYVANKEWNSVYRIEAQIKTAVDFLALESAAKEMKRKYPYFFSVISKYKNKYVLKKGYTSNIVFKDTRLCKPFDIFNGEPLMRILYTQNTISAEFFHGLTDGHGAQIFFNELLKEYCNIVFSKYSYDYPKVEVMPKCKEMLKTDDIYSCIYGQGGKSVSRFMSKAYQFDRDEESVLNSVDITVSSAALKTAAHKYGASITQYLCAVELAAIIKTQKIKDKTVRISVPVDIRKYFDFASIRNASLYFLVEIKPNETKDFNALIASVKEQFEKNLTKENMQNLAYSNVKCAKMKAFNILPVNLKKAVLNIGYTSFGENQFTSTLTNLGIVKPDIKVQNLVSNIYFVLGKEKTKPLNLTVTTYNERVNIVVSSVIKCDNFIQTVRDILAGDGIASARENLTAPIKINTEYNAES